MFPDSILSSFTLPPWPSASRIQPHLLGLLVFNTGWGWALPPSRNCSKYCLLTQSSQLWDPALLLSTGLLFLLPLIPTASVPYDSTEVLSYSFGVQKSIRSLVGLKSASQQVFMSSQFLGKNLFPCLFQYLEAACLQSSWAWVSWCCQPLVPSLLSRSSHVRTLVIPLVLLDNSWSSLYIKSSWLVTVITSSTFVPPLPCKITYLQVLRINTWAFHEIFTYRSEARTAVLWGFVLGTEGEAGIDPVNPKSVGIYWPSVLRSKDSLMGWKLGGRQWNPHGHQDNIIPEFLSWRSG